MGMKLQLFSQNPVTLLNELSQLSIVEDMDLKRCGTMLIKSMTFLLTSSKKI
jgi:hypothetical protein